MGENLVGIRENKVVWEKDQAAKKTTKVSEKKKIEKQPSKPGILLDFIAK